MSRPLLALPQDAFTEIASFAALQDILSLRECAKCFARLFEIPTEPGAPLTMTEDGGTSRRPESPLDVAPGGWTAVRLANPLWSAVFRRTLYPEGEPSEAPSLDGRFTSASCASSATCVLEEYLVTIAHNDHHKEQLRSEWERINDLRTATWLRALARVTRRSELLPEAPRFFMLRWMRLEVETRWSSMYRATNPADWIHIAARAALSEAQFKELLGTLKDLVELSTTFMVVEAELRNADICDIELCRELVDNFTSANTAMRVGSTLPSLLKKKKELHIPDNIRFVIRQIKEYLSETTPAVNGILQYAYVSDAPGSKGLHRNLMQSVVALHQDRNHGGPGEDIELNYLRYPTQFHVPRRMMNLETTTFHHLLDLSRHDPTFFLPKLLNLAVRGNQMDPNAGDGEV